MILLAQALPCPEVKRWRRGKLSTVRSELRVVSKFEKQPASTRFFSLHSDNTDAMSSRSQSDAECAAWPFIGHGDACNTLSAVLAGTASSKQSKAHHLSTRSSHCACSRTDGPSSQARMPPLFHASIIFGRRKRVFNPHHATLKGC